MSSINSVSVNGPYGSGIVGSSLRGRSSDAEKQIEKELSKFLESKGFSAEEQESIKKELRASVQSSLGGGGRPDPTKIQGAIQGVFEKHGIDSKEFLKNLPSPPGRGGPGAGKPAGGLASAANSEAESLQTLIDILAEQADKQKTNAKTSTTANSNSRSEPNSTSGKSDRLANSNRLDIDA